MGSARKTKAYRFAKALLTRTLDFEFSGMPFHLRDMPVTRLTTMAHTFLNLSGSRPGRPWYPMQLHIESAASCTLHCPLCPIGTRTTDRSNSTMHFPLFRSLMDEVGDHAVIALMWLWGEPFMNRKLPDMISYAHSKGLGTFTSTNGQHIETRDDAEQLVASGLDNLIVSVDGATQETYGKYRVGGELRKVIRTLDLIHRAKRFLGSATPGINVQTVVTRENEHELLDVERIARQYGADMVSRVVLRFQDFAGTETRDRFNPQSPSYQGLRYHDPEGMAQSIRSYKCCRPWNRMTVTADGTVLPCEHDYNGSAAFGRAGDGKSFMDVWHSGMAEKCRSQMLADKTVYSFCADCTYAFRSPTDCVSMMKLR